MSRRIRWQILIALAGSLTVLFLFGSLALQTAATSLPFYRSAYVEGVVGVPRQLNPLLQRAGAPPSEHDLRALIFDGLTRAGPDGYPEPVLAEEWSIDPAANVYTFTLRSGLRWHDGVSFTPEDVVFTVHSVQHRSFAGDPALADLWRNVLVEQVDANRVRFTLREPFAPFLAATALPILPRHLLEDIPPDQWPSAPFSRRPIGTGPFRLHTLDDTQAILRPFESAARGRPKLDLMVLRFYPSSDTAIEALRRRDVQGVAAMPARDEQSSAAEPEGTWRLPLGEYVMLTFNLREEPLDDVRLRTALAQALDRDELLRRVQSGRALRLDTPLLPQMWAHGRATLPAPSKEQAASSLDALGWRAGTSGPRTREGSSLQLTLSAAGTSDQLAASEVARQWRALGIDVTVEPLAEDELHDRLRQRVFSVAIHHWTDAGADPDVFALWHSSQAEQGLNYAGLADPQIDRLIEDGRAAVDRDIRARIYGELERRWVALAPSIPLYQPLLLYSLDDGVHPAGLDGARLLEQPSSRFDTISDWLVEPLP